MTRGILRAAAIWAIPAAAVLAGDAWERDFRRDIQSRDAAERVAAVQALAAYDGAEAVERLIDKALDPQDAPVYRAALQVLRGFRSPEAVGVVVALLSEPRVREPIPLLDALGPGAGAAGVEAARPYLTREEWPVRAAAIEALERLHDDGAVPALIDRLGSEQGRLRGDALRALQSITGQTLGLNPTAWTQWQQNRDAPAAVGEEVQTPSFFEIDIVSHRMVLVIDVSGSMRRHVADQQQFDQSELGDTPGTRMAMLKEELRRTIEGLPTGVEFNMVFFGAEVRSWKSGLVEANPTNLREALRTVDALGADRNPGTITLEAMREAFQNGEADTIYLMTDGIPEGGEVAACGGLVQRVDTVLGAVRDLNTGRKVVIHTVGLQLEGMGAGGNEAMANEAIRLVRTLAEETGGRYIEKKE